MGLFDLAIIDFLNQFSQRSWAVDYTIKFISGNHLLKGGVLLALFWWGWFGVSKDQTCVRIHLVATLFSCFMAIIVAKSLAFLLPFRFRPIHEEGLNFTLPYGVKLAPLEGWSSFPSDHAVLFYALSVGMFYISKKAGIFALIYTTLFIGLPRVYLGLHYPSDIVGGALIGVVLAMFCNTNSFFEKTSQSILNFSSTRPEIFYPVFFIVTYQIADLFDNSRALVSFINLMFQAALT